MRTAYAKTQVLGNKNRELGRENFSVKNITGEELSSFDVKRKMNWLERLVRVFE